jgi:predicted esterase
MLMQNGSRVIGLWMGGCNEDRASDALRWHKPGTAFFQVPIFLSSGLADPIATPAQHAAVRDAMGRAGFRNVRLETYAGTHWMNAAQIAAGLRWFKEIADKP